jgi:enoyl-CoA hydratase/carnithine racemase
MNDDILFSRRQLLGSALISAAASVGEHSLASESHSHNVDAKTPNYFSAFPSVHISRSASGVVTLRLHTNEQAFRLTFDAYAQLPQAFQAISLDPQNRVLIITRTGDSFIESADLSTFGDLRSALGWQAVMARARRAVQGFVDVDIPVIAAVNGPVPLHSEWALLADIVIAAEDSWFDDPHLAGGLAPGDGTSLAWIELLGLNRARSMLLLKERLTARSAFEWGVIRELKARDQVLPRAREIAEQLTQWHPTTLRATRQALTYRLRRVMAEGLAVGWNAEALSAWR